MVDSTTVAEYAALEVTKEGVLIRKFIQELDVIPSIAKSVALHCDNTEAIAQAKEPREHHKSKHVLMKFHSLRKIVDRRDIKICKVHMDDNVADPLTKPLSQMKHEGHTTAMGIKHVGDWL